MKHRRRGRKLGRNSKQRKALFKSLIVSLVHHGGIETTESKAKAVRPIIDRLVAKARSSSLSAHRQLQAFLQDKAAVARLIQEVGPAFTRRFGFTKMFRTRVRRGDRAQMVRLEWTEIPGAAGRDQTDKKAGANTGEGRGRKQDLRRSSKAAGGEG